MMLKSNILNNALRIKQKNQSKNNAKLFSKNDIIIFGPVYAALFYTGPTNATR